MPPSALDISVPPGGELGLDQLDQLALEAYGKKYDELSLEEREGLGVLITSPLDPKSGFFKPAGNEATLAPSALSGGADEFYASEVQRLANQRAGAKGELDEAAAQLPASAEPMSREQAVYSTALALLPMLAGLAIKGRRGGLAGAKAGLVGTGMMLKDRQEFEKRRQDVADLEYKNAAGDYKSALDDESALARTRVMSELTAERQAAYGKQIADRQFELQDRSQKQQTEMQTRRELQEKWRVEANNLAKEEQAARDAENELKKMREKYDLVGENDKAKWDRDMISLQAKADSAKANINLTYDRMSQIKQDGYAAQMGLEDFKLDRREAEAERGRAFKDVQAGKQRGFEAWQQEDRQAHDVENREDKQLFSAEQNQLGREHQTSERKGREAFESGQLDKRLKFYGVRQEEVFAHREKMAGLNEASKQRLMQYGDQLKNKPLTDQQASELSSLLSTPDHKVEPQALKDPKVAKMFLDITKQELAKTKEQRLQGQAKYDVLSKSVGDVGWSKPPSDQDKKDVVKLTAAFNTLDNLSQRLTALIKERGISVLGTDAAEREIIGAWQIMQYKNMQGLGANFTWFEQKLTRDALGSYATFKDLIKRGLQGTFNRKDAVTIANKARAYNWQMYDDQLRARNAYRIGAPYRPEVAKARGIRMDESGRAVDSGILDQFAEDNFGGVE